MKRKLVLCCAAALAFIVGYGTLAHAYPSPPPFGRAEHRGYFANGTDPDNAGTFVLDNIYDMGGAGNFAMPNSLDSAGELESFIKAKLSGDTWDKVGASFIIETMIGNKSNTRPMPATTAQYNQWKADVDAYAAAGRITWKTSGYCYTLNTYNMHGRSGPGPNDDAFYDVSKECTDSTYSAIVFKNPDGTTYAIRRQCANPVGGMSPLQSLTNYTLTPSITPSASTVETGQSVTWKYTITHGGTTTATGVVCKVFANTHTGSISPNPPNPPETSGSNPGVPGCPASIAATTQYATETINNVPGNSTICRTLTVTPAVNGSGTKSTESCVTVTNKPYMRVFGGDTSAGNGFTSGGTCTGNNDAAVVSWNREAAGAYAGAGSQFATYALDVIYDYASNLGNASATNGSTLSFANSGAPGGGYGGSFGSLPCIKDYYGTLPASHTTYGGGGIPSTSDNFLTSGSVTISGGTLAAGQRTIIYVNGDAIITGNIKYPANWTLANAPLFEIIAKGNIYIDKGVSQLDGLYVAQPTGTAKGVIYTCATGTTPYAPTALSANCSSPLTINGAFVAYQVQLLRSSGSLLQSSAGETPATTKAAEIFNFSPMMWMVAPPGQGTSDGYDSITSLPPIL